MKIRGNFLTDTRSFLKIAGVCLLALAFNFLSVFVFYETLHLPLFLDTIFTIAVLFYYGLFPALLVQISYNIVNSLVWIKKTGSFDVFMMLYAICGILIVFSTWTISRRKEEFKISMSIIFLYLILIALISSACSVIAGGIIDYFHLKYNNIPDMMNPIKKFTESFERQKLNLFVSCIVAQVPVSFTDRLITTFAGFGVYKLIQKIAGKEF